MPEMIQIFFGKESERDELEKGKLGEDVTDDDKKWDMEE